MDLHTTQVTAARHNFKCFDVNASFSFVSEEKEEKNK